MGLACEGDVLRLSLDGSQGAPVMGVTSAGIAKFLRVNSSGQLQTELASSASTIGVVDQGNRNADGSLGWRVMEFGPSGLPNAYFNIFGIFEIPTVIVGDPNTGTPWSFINGGGLGLGLVNLRNSVGTECGITGNPWVTNIHQWGGTNTTLGQKTMTASVPVVIASNQSTITVTLDKPTIAPLHTAPAIATTSTTALAANANRKYALFVNDSDTTIYLFLGTPAVVSQGIRLNARGGSYETMQIHNLYTGIVTAIHGGTGTKTLLVTEGT